MGTFNRYFLHFLVIGIVFLIGAILLLALDGGELLVPIFLIVITLVDICFIALMSIMFSSMAKPQVVKLKKDNHAMKKLEHIAKNKWGRKIIIKEEDGTRFVFGNKYKDWLATTVEVVEYKNNYMIHLPNAYMEDIKYLREI